MSTLNKPPKISKAQQKMLKEAMIIPQSEYSSLMSRHTNLLSMVFLGIVDDQMREYAVVEYYYTNKEGKITLDESQRDRTVFFVYSTFSERSIRTVDIMDISNIIDAFSYEVSIEIYLDSKYEAAREAKKLAETIQQNQLQPISQNPVES